MASSDVDATVRKGGTDEIRGVCPETGAAVEMSTEVAVFVEENGASTGVIT